MEYMNYDGFILKKSSKRAYNFTMSELTVSI